MKHIVLAGLVVGLLSGCGSMKGSKTVSNYDDAYFTPSDIDKSEVYGKTNPALFEMPRATASNTSSRGSRSYGQSYNDRFRNFGGGAITPGFAPTMVYTPRGASLMYSPYSYNPYYGMGNPYYRYNPYMAYGYNPYYGYDPYYNSSWCYWNQYYSPYNSNYWGGGSSGSSGRSSWGRSNSSNNNSGSKNSFTNSGQRRSTYNSSLPPSSQSGRTSYSSGSSSSSSSSSGGNTYYRPSSSSSSSSSSSGSTYSRPSSSGSSGAAGGSQSGSTQRRR